MTDQVVQNQTDVFVTVKMIQDATGSNPGDPATGITAATAGHEIWYQRENEAVVTDAGSAADASGLTDAHTDWEFDEIRDGYYQIAVPDAAFVDGAGYVLVGMDADGSEPIVEKITIDHFLKFYGKADSVTASTTTFPAGVPVYAGDIIYAISGTGAGQTRRIQSVSGQVATHRTWDVNISDTATVIMLAPGPRGYRIDEIAGVELGLSGAGGQSIGAV